MTVYKPGEINIQELLQRQHEKYGKRMQRNYNRVVARNKAKELHLGKKKIKKLVDKYENI